MQTDGLIPITFGDKDGWPAMGTFDILNLRLNGYDFHTDLLTGKQKWTDPKVTTVFQKWAEIMPFHDKTYAGLTWQKACDTLIQKKSGMFTFGLFLTGEFTSTGSPADLADLDFFPFPALGNPVRCREGARRADRHLDGQRQVADPPGRPRRGQGVHGVLGRRARPSCSCSRTSRASSRQRNDADTSTLRRAHQEGRPDRRARPRRSPSSSTATRGRTSRAPTGCRASCRTSWQPDPGHHRPPGRDPGVLGRAPAGNRLGPNRASCLDPAGSRASAPAPALGWSGGDRCPGPASGATAS